MTEDLGRLVTPIFLSMGRFLCRFSTYISSRILNILQNTPSNSVHLTSSFSCTSVSNSLLRLRFVKIMAIFEIINATDSLIQYNVYY